MQLDDHDIESCDELSMQPKEPEEKRDKIRFGASAQDKFVDTMIHSTETILEN